MNLGLSTPAGGTVPFVLGGVPNGIFILNMTDVAWLNKGKETSPEGTLLRLSYLNGLRHRWPSRCPLLGISFWRSCEEWRLSLGISLRKKTKKQQSAWSLKGRAQWPAADSGFLLRRCRGDCDKSDDPARRRRRPCIWDLEVSRLMLLSC